MCSNGVVERGGARPRAERPAGREPKLARGAVGGTRKLRPAAAAAFSHPRRARAAARGGLLSRPRPGETADERAGRGDDRRDAACGGAAVVRSLRTPYLSRRAAAAVGRARIARADPRRHDAATPDQREPPADFLCARRFLSRRSGAAVSRSEEHTSELQSLAY